jgi:hypothetical protein
MQKKKNPSNIALVKVSDYQNLRAYVEAILLCDIDMTGASMCVFVAGGICRLEFVRACVRVCVCVCVCGLRASISTQYPSLNIPYFLFKFTP